MLAFEINLDESLISNIALGVLVAGLVWLLVRLIWISLRKP